MSKSAEFAELAAMRARVDAFYAQQDADKAYLHSNVKAHIPMLRKEAAIKYAAELAHLRAEQAKVKCKNELLQPGQCKYGAKCYFMH